MFAAKRPRLETAQLRFETVPVAEDGDLTLVVSSGHQASTSEPPFSKKLTVCSKTLSRASPVFKRMLYGEFAESKQQQPWIVQLQDDDPQAFELLLYTMHARFDKTPFSLSVEDLFYATALTDKYDMTHLLRPWAHQCFMEGYDGVTLTDCEKSRPQNCLLEKQLWISWEMGHQPQLVQLIRNLAVYSRVGADGDLLSIEDDGTEVPRFKDTLIPSNLDGG